MSTNTGGRVLRLLGLLFLLDAVIVFGFWGATGAAIVTQYEVPVEIEEEDEFGDVVTRTTMIEQFRFGLLPDRGYDGALPLGGGAAAIGVAFLLVARSRARAA